MLIYSHSPLTRQAVRHAKAAIPYIGKTPGNMTYCYDAANQPICLVVCKKPGVLQVIYPKPLEEHMLLRSAADCCPKEGESVFAFTIMDNTDTMVRYLVDKSRTRAITLVSDYLKNYHPTWRLRRVDRVPE